jgi:hypothetical protein
MVHLFSITLIDSSTKKQLESYSSVVIPCVGDDVIIGSDNEKKVFRVAHRVLSSKTNNVCLHGKIK